MTNFIRDRRGYFGIGIEGVKFKDNVGTLFRTASNFGADFIFTVGARYTRKCTDTTDTAKHKLLLHWDTPGKMLANIPQTVDIVGIEDIDPLVGIATNLVDFEHPEKAVYILGAEDHGLSQETLKLCKNIVSIPTIRCTNVAIAGAVVMYDRYVKRR